MNIIILQDTLLFCVKVQLSILVRKHSIGLVVVDSVASVFRSETDMINRANDLREFGLSLLELANEHSFSIVCVNQVL